MYPKLVEQIDVMPHGPVLLRCASSEFLEPVTDRYPTPTVLEEENGPGTAHIGKSMARTRPTVNADMAPTMPHLGTRVCDRCHGT